MGPYFDLAPLGILGAELAHRAVAFMTTKTLHGLAAFVSLTFVIQLVAGRTTNRVNARVVSKMLGGIRILAGGLWGRGRAQHTQTFFKRGPYIRPRATP